MSTTKRFLENCMYKDPELEEAVFNGDNETVAKIMKDKENDKQLIEEFIKENKGN